MLDKGHNKIRYDDEGSSELADFFDYSTLMRRGGMEIAMDSSEALNWTISSLMTKIISTTRRKLMIIP